MFSLFRSGMIHLDVYYSLAIYLPVSLATWRYFIQLTQA